ncbi:MAG: zinc ribbon domain-containing protein [Candidatus Limiplasma sp.]|nr:zinc ribbon domain-containing protein [Candidatus Limiplasma sp.]
MSEILCPTCGKNVAHAEGASFCPYCGGALAKAAQPPEADAVRALLDQVAAMDNPRKKYDKLAQAMERYPDSLAIAEELLFLGRLHERSARQLDFSVIKSYLLMLYLEPETLVPEQIAAMREAIFSHPDLQRCLRLAADPNAFLDQYLTKLSTQFIELFLRGSSRYMRRFFGMGLESRAPKYLAAPAGFMLAAMQQDDQLTQEQRARLMRAFFRAFNTQLGGDTQWLLQEMQTRGVAMP